MSRAHRSLPSKVKLLRTPVPVITQTAVPSVTGEGDDMFCLRMSWSPPPSSCFQRTAPVLRSSAHR